MILSWNEIKSRALEFSQEWAGEASEDAEAKSFWDAFFRVFGINRRRLASFEKAVKKLSGKQGFIDLFWESTLIVEHKSKGRSLDKAFEQATDYFHGLEDYQLPKFVLVSDFAKFRLYDLEKSHETFLEFALEDLHKNVEQFGFIAGYQKRVYKEQDPVNIKAAENMGRLHDRLKEIGYTGHGLELYLVRLLFCLFADDGGIFEKGIFAQYLEEKTNEDGSDLAMHLGQLFEVLNTPKDKRYKTLDESLNEFPYVNGKLFEERLSTASFDSKMRTLLLESSALDWGQISPAIFGSLFQSVMDEDARRNLGAHYTSEKNILKLIKPLFLDDLWAERNKAKGDKNKLRNVHDKLARLRFIDPACGCGNFLIVAYRELRMLELDILKELYPVGQQQLLDIESILKLSVDQFYGIEYEEFPAQIAQVAMWLIDHQMNMKTSEAFGLYYVRLPLTKAATIVHGNALRLKWEEVLNLSRDAENLSQLYILGNPPFIGSKMMTPVQRQELTEAFDGAKDVGVLDYVCAWYAVATKLMTLCKNTYPHLITKTAFVSTNSIAQGEQVAILWSPLFAKGAKLHFAHQTFRWSNEARGKAAVHCVIVGFALVETPKQKLFEYLDINSESHEIEVDSLNAYLVNGKNLLIFKRQQPISPFPEMQKGSQPTDGGNLLFTNDEKSEFLKLEPNAEKFIRPFLGSDEFINNIKRWCLWLTGISPSELRALPHVLARVEKVKQSRLASPKAATVKWAQMPTLFTETRQPDEDYLLIPSVSSENRRYIPIGYLGKNVVASNLAFTLPRASKYLFGVLGSVMHMAWVRHIAGRLKSDFRYSNTLVYNNFPFPQSPTPKQIESVEKAAQSVLDARLLYPTSSLADLYDPTTRPPELTKAHTALDKAVDACYGKTGFESEAKRMEFLFELYDMYTKGFLAEEKPKRSRKKAA
jgi:type II restriction/modification system DNA methylase subunit YeeA